MRFSSALISFLSSLSTTSVAIAMEEPRDSVLHDITASILEESLKVKYRNKKSYLEPLKIQNSNDGPPKNANNANDVELPVQKKELIHHLVDHQEHQEEKSLEECKFYPTTTTTTAAATSDDDSLMKRKISSDKEGIKKMDYGHLNRGTCSSPNDACVPQNKAIEGNGAFLEPEDASYASSGYCVPLSFVEDMEYKNVVTTTMSLSDNEEFNKEEEMTDSYYYYHPQYDHHHRQLDSLNCASLCSGEERPDVSSYDGSFKLLTVCYANGGCRADYPVISCWNTTGITDMSYGFSNSGGKKFNAPLECWDVSQVKTMHRMFSRAYNFNQPLDSWDVSQVKDMYSMFNRASSFNQPIDSWNVSEVGRYNYGMRYMFFGASEFNQCLSTWAEKTYDYVDTFGMLVDTDCPNGIENPDATIGPWCQNYTQGCFATATPTNECNNVDESDFSFKGKSCKKYLKKKTEKKCKKTIDGVLVADSCPSLCKRFCPPCKNKSGKIKLENGKRFNCKKIKKKKKCNSITKSGALANEICPVACKFEGC